MVRIHELSMHEAAEEVRQRERVRGGDQELPVGLEQQLRDFEESTRLVEMFEQFAGEYHVGRFEVKLPNLGSIFAIGRVGRKAEFPRETDALFVCVYADGARGRRGCLSV